MPVGVRAGMASMVQIDGSLDEAAHTLRLDRAANDRAALLKPAIVAALVRAPLASVGLPDSTRGFRPSCPAASSSAWRWHVRSCSSLRCCFSTSRFPTWIRGYEDDAR
jgi:hypothetical protein